VILFSADSEHFLKHMPLTFPLCVTCLYQTFLGLVDKPASCDSPLCRDAVYAWASGAGALIMPDVAGFPVSSQERYFILQVVSFLLSRADVHDLQRNITAGLT
jgi:hypothetical protein